MNFILHLFISPYFISYYIHDAMNAGTRCTLESKTGAKALHGQQFKMNVYLVEIGSSLVGDNYRYKAEREVFRAS